MKRNLILALLGALGCSTGLAFGQGAEVKVGEWAVITRPQPEKSPNPLCILRSPQAETVDQLQLTNSIKAASDAKTTHGNALLIIYSKNAVNVEKQVDLPQIDFSIDGRTRWTVPAALTKLESGKGALRATLDPEVSKVIGRLAQGNSLDAKVDLPNNSALQLSVSLSGSARALAAFEQCLDTVSLK
jgi:hypothetical protein